MIEINGATGEGGGQIVRTSLALALITGQEFTIRSVRANRARSGLRPQHLAAVELAARISNARVEGVGLDAAAFSFFPGEIRAGNYRHKIPTAGSAVLLLQTVALPLISRASKSTLNLTGGTHVPFSPAYPYIEHTWKNYLTMLGLRMKMDLDLAGYYPLGGGEIRCQLFPASTITPVHLTEKGKLVRLRGCAVVSNLDPDIARRMKHQILSRLQPITRDVKISVVEQASPGTGAYCCIIAEFERTTQTFCALGKKGKRAEVVADEAVDSFLNFLQVPGAIDRYSADQLLLPLSFAEAESIFTTTELTSHLFTNAEIINQFIGCEISISGAPGGPGEVRLVPHKGLRQYPDKGP